MLLPLTQVLVDLHRHGIVHRQIKPEHVLCRAEEGAVTLVDFAEAVNKNQRCLNNRAGSLEYMVGVARCGVVQQGTVWRVGMG